MAIAVGQRDEHIEGIAWQRQKIGWFRARTAESRHGPSLSVFGIAINGIVSRRHSLVPDSTAKLDRRAHQRTVITILAPRAGAINARPGSSGVPPVNHPARSSELGRRDVPSTLRKSITGAWIPSVDRQLDHTTGGSKTDL